MSQYDDLVNDFWSYTQDENVEYSTIDEAICTLFAKSEGKVRRLPIRPRSETSMNATSSSSSSSSSSIINSSSSNAGGGRRPSLTIPKSPRFRTLSTGFSEENLNSKQIETRKPSIPEAPEVHLTSLPPKRPGRINLQLQTTREISEERKPVTERNAVTIVPAITLEKTLPPIRDKRNGVVGSDNSLKPVIANKSKEVEIDISLSDDDNDEDR